jgi:hypothetical protein
MTFVTRRFQPGSVTSFRQKGKVFEPVVTDETHPIHSTLLSPGVVTEIDLRNIRPWSTSKLQRELQQVAFNIEFTNFGSESVTLKANQVVSNTEKIDADRVDAVRRKRDVAERTWAKAFLSATSSWPEGDRKVMEAAQKVLSLLQEMSDNFDAVTRKWKNNEWRCQERDDAADGRVASLWPPARFKNEPEEDDGLKDIDRFVIPEDVPEVGSHSRCHARPHLCVALDRQNFGKPKATIKGEFNDK